MVELPGAASLALDPSTVLRCVECGRTGSAADGWRAYLSGGHDIGELETAVYCLNCAEHEFS